MTKIYQHYGLNPRLKQLDVDEQIELISDSNDVIMEKIVRFFNSPNLALYYGNSEPNSINNDQKNQQNNIQNSN